jgi:hypothetical protein
MQALNSTSEIRKRLAVTGIGVLVAFLFLAPLATAAASYTVTISSPTAGSFVPSGTPITVSGTVSPAPSSSGTYIGISIVQPNGQTADANEFAVAMSTGDFNGTFTPGSSYAQNGTYSIDVNYAGATATVSFTYGSNSTSSSSQTGVTTTIENNFTTTISQGYTTTVSGATVTTVVSSATTITSVVNSITTVVSSVTSGSSGTALAIGALGVIIAIIAAVLAVVAMRKKK